MNGEEGYEAYCTDCDYRWTSVAKDKPPKCPECGDNDNVIYGDEIPTEQEPGEPLKGDITRDDDIVNTARDIIDMTEADIDWERIRKLEKSHKPRTIVIHFKDSGKLFGIRVNSVNKEAQILDRNQLERYTGNPAGVVDFIYEDIGWQILEGEIPIQVARYEYQDKVIDIATVSGKKEMFWMACSSIFNDIRKKNKQLIENIRSW